MDISGNIWEFIKNFLTDIRVPFNLENGTPLSNVLVLNLFAYATVLLGPTRFVKSN